MSTGSLLSSSSRLALFLIAALALPALAAPLPQQDADADVPTVPRGEMVPVTEANWELAARFAPYRWDNLVKDTRVEPHWIEGTNRFWFDFETSADGKRFWIVDPSARGDAVLQELFDRHAMAAAITRIVKDPYDARHLPIDRIRFVRDGAAFRFEVESTEEEEVEYEVEIEDQEEERDEDREREQRQEREEQQQEEDQQLEEQQIRQEDERELERQTETRKGKRPKKYHFEYDLATGELRQLEDPEEPPEHPEWASISPDGQWVVFAREYDLYMMDRANYEEWLEKEKARKEREELERGADKGKEEQDEDEPETDVDPDIEEIRLTDDGEEHYSWGSTFGRRGKTDKEWEEERGKRQRAMVVWSQDSRKFALMRFDQREVDDLWVIHHMKDPRPELETYRYDMPGEENVTQNELWVFDIDSRERVRVQAEAFPDQSLDIATKRQVRYPDAEWPKPPMWLAPGSDRLYFERMSRDRKRVDVAVADTATGDVTPLIEERLNTYIETQRLERLDSGEMIWWSERDGWGHYYLFDAEGNEVRQLTSGPWSGRGVIGIDEERRTLFFEASGRDPADPYYRHVFAVSLDGGEPVRLTEPGFDHDATMGESTAFFVDNHSRVDTVPSVAMVSTGGSGGSGARAPGGPSPAIPLAEADFSALRDAGYRFPETFEVKADDGVTDIYGVMYKPFDFDPDRRYPIIAYVYPGPQTESVPKSWNSGSTQMALAQLGFIVIASGNRGGHPWRSKWYHNYGYGDLRDYGLADKVATIRQLAARHPWIDLDRVGIYGHSGGGFMTTAAMLVYPDFFKVGVASAGNHENNVYNRWWSETHHGVKEVVDDEGEVTFEYDIDRNSELAANLRGKLLLTTGDVDNNVHPANTFRMAAALIEANKRFDFFMFPGQRHGFGEMNDYWFWLRAEYFAEHLLGDERTEVDLVELRIEAGQNGRDGRRRSGSQ